ncbi:MAG TPA: hypothetical protein DCS93_14640 [Microscillaceae bacterium]|nr:hypothetical protein [Microscillaceae bacterium]
MSKKMKLPKKTFLVCTGKKCGSKGGYSHYKNLRGMIRKEGAKDDLQVMRLQCTGNCKQAPVVGLMPKNKWYAQADGAKVEKLFKKAIKPPKKKKNSD